MRRASLFILLFLIAGFERVAAVEVRGGLSQAAAPEAVTETAFLAAVSADHPASRALAAELGKAEAQRLRAALLADPRLELSRESPDEAARETTWGISWTPPIDGRRSKAVTAAEAGVEAEALRLEGRLLDLRLQAREAYADWATGEARMSLLAEHGRRLESLARWMKDRAEAGEESLLAARRLGLAAERARVALARARASAAGWRERAAVWLPDGGEDLSAMRPQLPRLSETPADLDTTDADARPDVQAVGREVERARALVQLSRRVVEAPDLLLGWKSIDDDPAGAAADTGGPVVAIGWTIPVFDRRRADRLAAESRLDTTVAGEEWAIRQARGELAAALAAYEELRRSALASGEALRDLDGMARAATAGFEQGESTVTDLLDTLRALLEARLDHLDLHGLALEAHRRLEAAAGRVLATGDLS